ncbi:GGDEF domain-containing protein [Klenkia brasiliensis]|uniref:Diguanylate cyclase (GGDEF) domain-containing protein n=1 Tax=Klenkia brasiliensis TaxID=333142 RepID=A0A1G7N2Q0_9ACTN|nr:GGDEF domain-containing protein [Klenkia brasiliensis]SDF67590.1 diguanylate cyclase (GGDEF) domain-containing protein [Klenkia brasiliensis]
MVAAVLLGTAFVLLLAMMVALPHLGVPAPVFGWVVLALFAANAALCLLAPRGSAASDLSVPLAALVAVLACSSMWGLLLGQLNAGVSLMGLPVVFAVSQLRRAAALAVTVLSCAASVTVLAVVGTWTGLRALDAGLVCASLLMLAAAMTHHVDTSRQLVAELERVATVDGVTGLATRRVLDDSMTDSLSRFPRTGTALVLVDLDHFKAVNDQHGHPVGDAALRHVGAVLTAAVRSTDAVVSRLGGDELAVLLPGCPVGVAGARAAELVAAVRAAPLVLPDGTELRLTVSVGVAHAPEHARDVRALYSAADSALYVVKRAGRDGCAVAAGARPARLALGTRPPLADPLADRVLPRNRPLPPLPPRAA